MARVTFTKNLERFFPGLKPGDFGGANVAEVLQAIDGTYPGIRDYLVDERGALRKHVNIFVNAEMIRDRQELSDPVESHTEIFFAQALSGG